MSLFGDLSSSSETQDMNLRESGLDTDTFACNGKNKNNQSMFLYSLLFVFECVFRSPRFGSTDRYLVVLMEVKIIKYHIRKQINKQSNTLLLAAI